jgi:hypothetical protein
VRDGDFREVAVDETFAFEEFIALRATMGMPP